MAIDVIVLTQRTAANLSTKRVSREINYGVAINTVKLTQWKEGDPVPDKAISKWNSYMTVNMMNSLGSTWDPIIRSASNDMTANVMGWKNEEPAGNLCQGSRLMCGCMASLARAVSDAVHGIDVGTSEILKLQLLNQETVKKSLCGMKGGSNLQTFELVSILGPLILCKCFQKNSDENTIGAWNRSLQP